jgi:hypothetical protein
MRDSLVGARLAFAGVGTNVGLGTNVSRSRSVLSGFYKILGFFDTHLNSIKLEVEPQD